MRQYRTGFIPHSGQTETERQTHTSPPTQWQGWSGQCGTRCSHCQGSPCPCCWMFPDWWKRPFHRVGPGILGRNRARWRLEGGSSSETGCASRSGAGNRPRSGPVGGSRSGGSGDGPRSGPDWSSRTAVDIRTSTVVGPTMTGLGEIVEAWVLLEPEVLSGSIMSKPSRPASAAGCVGTSTGVESSDGWSRRNTK